MKRVRERKEKERKMSAPLRHLPSGTAAAAASLSMEVLDAYRVECNTLIYKIKHRSLMEFFVTLWR